MSDPTQPQAWPQQARDDVSQIQQAAGDLEQLQGAPPAAPVPGVDPAAGQVIPGAATEAPAFDPNAPGLPTPAPFADAPPPPAPPPAPTGPPPVFGVGNVVSYTYPETGTGVPIVRFGVVVGVAPAGEEGRGEAGYVVGWLPDVSHPIPGSTLSEVT